MIYDRWIKYDIYVNIYIYGDDEDDGDDDDDDDDHDYDFDFDDDDDDGDDDVDDELTWRNNCIWVGYASKNQPIWEYSIGFHWMQEDRGCWNS